jgi:hypothetical protein
MRLDNDSGRRLRQALGDAFRSYDQLEQMLNQYLNEWLPDIVPDRLNLKKVRDDLVNWAESNDRVIDLLDAAEQANPTNGLLKAVSAKIRQQPNEAGLIKDPDYDPYDEHILIGGVPFVDREKLRKELRNFHSTGGLRIIQVRHPGNVSNKQKLGLSYHSWLIRHAQGFKGFELALFDFAEAGPPTPRALAKTIADQIGVRAPVPPPGDDQTPPWYAVSLRDWLIKALEATGRECWIVLDGYHLDKVSSPTHDLIRLIANRIPGKWDRLRLVLLGYEGSLDDGIAPLVAAIPLRRLTCGDVAKYLARVFPKWSQHKVEQKARWVCAAATTQDPDRLRKWMDRLRKLIRTHLLELHPSPAPISPSAGSLVGLSGKSSR